MNLYLAFYFVVGACAGSFLNLCACRILQGRSVVFGRSACDSCGHKLGVLDLVPLVSYAFLRGRCRYCGAAYGCGHLLAELITGLLFALCGLHFAPGWHLLLAWWLAGCLVILVLTDLKEQILPDGVVSALALGGALNAVLYLPGGVTDALYGAAAGFGIMLGIFLISRGGMGGGDVKLSAAAGLWLGWQNTLLFLLLAFIAGGIAAVLLLLCRRKNGGDAIPFGPFLCAAALAVFLYAPHLWHFYWQLFL